MTFQNKLFLESAAAFFFNECLYRCENHKRNFHLHYIGMQKLAAEILKMGVPNGKIHVELSAQLQQMIPEQWLSNVWAEIIRLID